MLTRRRERLREQLDRLEQHGSGLGDVDAELRLVVANRRYAEIYGLKPADLRPGTPLRELMEQRDAKDEHAAKPSSLNIVRAVAVVSALPRRRKASRRANSSISSGRRAVPRCRTSS